MAMSWAEIKPKIGNLAFDFEQNGWPEPTDPEFWKWVNIDEALPVVANQFPKYVEQNSEMGIVLAKAYLMMIEVPMSGDTERIASVLKTGKVYEPPSLEATLSGALVSALLDHMKVPRKLQSIYLPDFKERNPDFSAKLSDSDFATKAVAWWSFWGDISAQWQRSQSEFVSLNDPVMKVSEDIEFMVNELQMNPPVII